MTPVDPLTDQQLHSAIDRIARSEDGRTLYLFLQKSLMAVPTAHEDGALRQSHGERMFAARLISLMAKGISESGGRTGSSSDSTSGGNADQPIVFAVAAPRAVSTGGRGAARRVTADHRIPGWNDSEAG